MSFTPSLSLFIGLGVMAGAVSTLIAIAFHRIDTWLAQRSCDKALAARRARQAGEAQHAWEKRNDRYRAMAMGLAATKIAD
ncbi:hypothetical protein [Paraburkholderia solisilvae]|uniref:Uncharacterized protein n=1 Tax=Paraburkholderia solisilvae TaxID=624376 RepID=A0A6J5CW52_9BURK|nr:hypothetical protein [Paraburkholderia solisilvae]CAB3746380.1 hypothetical protein LMG29739_00170 [Paraburkholderia solisilvae]